MEIKATRAAIRHYLINLLKSEVDVGDRVFANRPTSPIFLEELPAICVFFTEENNEVWSGDNFFVKEYRRLLQVIVTISVEDVLDPSAEINTSQKGEDALDFIGEQVERAILHDPFLSRRLPGFDPNTNYHGLTHGVQFTGTVAYDVETEDERRVIGQDLRFMFPYQTPGYLDTIFKDFESYYAAIIRVGSNESTTDRVLIAAEGDIGNE